MFRRTTLLVVTISGLCACNLSAAQINSNWVGGESGDWGQASNWNPAIVPDNNADTYNVTINGGIIDVNFVTVTLSQAYTINKFDCDGWLKLYTNGFSLTLDSGQLTNSGKIEIEDSFTIIGDVVNTEFSEIASSWQFFIIGNLNNEPNGYVEVGHFMKVDHGGSSVKGFITNNGTISIWPNGQLVSDRNFENYGHISILDGSCQADKLFTNYSTGNINGHGTLYGWNGLLNYGIISVSGGSLSIISDGRFNNNGILFSNPSTSLYVQPDPDSDVNNHGLVEISMGSSMAFECNLANEPNGIIKLNGGVLSAGTIVQRADANFMGFGGITGDVVIDPNGIIKLTGPTNIVGDVNIATNATLEISDGTTLVTGHTTNNGTIHMKGGRLIPQGGITNNGNVIWEPGLYNNIADFNLDGKVNLKDFADFSETWLWQSEL